MEKRTEMIIRALKIGENSFDDRIKDAMAKYTGNHEWTYGREEVDKLLRYTCADYISTCDNPEKEIRRYFLEDTFITNEYQRMTIFLINTQVREVDFITGEDYYINGFNREVWE